MSSGSPGPSGLLTRQRCSGQVYISNLPGERWGSLVPGGAFCSSKKPRGFWVHTWGQRSELSPGAGLGGSREDRPLDASRRSLSSLVTFYLEEMFFKSQPPCETQPACNLGIVLPTKPQDRNTIPESHIVFRGGTGASQPTQVTSSAKK